MAIQAPKEKPAIQQRPGLGVEGLQPVQRRGGIAEFPLAIVAAPLAIGLHPGN